MEDLADDVLTLIDRLQLPRVILTGHSLGGMVAMDVARRDRRVCGLLLLEGWTSLSSSAAFSSGRFFGGLSTEFIAAIKDKREDMQRRFDPSVWEGFWTSVERFDGFAFLETTRIPIVEAYGSLGRKADAEARLRIPPKANVELKWIPEAGHFLPHESPREVAELCAYLTRKVDERE
jgi:pimeloyl-ACP methyl ester carboxylesterase